MIPTVSVVIPANNEEREIRRTLECLLSDAREGEFDVVVVPNACTDRTAEIAGSFPGVRVFDTPSPGKASALRLGDDACTAYPRLVLDADVRLSAESVRKLSARLQAGDGVLACSPRVEWDLSGCGPVARRAHLAHETLVEARRVLAGVGAYMLSKDACLRVLPMPDLIADDQYVNRSFIQAERCTVPDAVSVTQPAPSFRALVRRRARARAGNRQLDGLALRGAGAQRFGPRDLIDAVARRRVRVLDGCCFLAVVIAERSLVAWWRMRRTSAVWSVERRIDFSSTG